MSDEHSAATGAGELDKHIQRMASTGNVGSLIEWQAFTDALRAKDGEIERWKGHYDNQVDLTREMQADIERKDAEIERLRDLFRMDGEQHAAHIKALTEAHENRVNKYYAEIERLRAAEKSALELASRHMEQKHRLADMIEWMENMDPKLVDDARAALKEQDQ